MRIVTTTVADEGRRELAHNAERIESAEALVVRARAAGAAMVVLPAGFLRAKKESDVAEIASPVIKRARKEGVAIVIGVDACAPSAAIDVERSVARNALPFFVVAAGTSGGVRTWRQRSTTGANGARVDDEEIVRRTVRVGESDVDVLICGEVWSPRLRTELGDWSGRVVVAPMHAAAGARFWAAQRWASAADAKLVRAVHASKPASVVEGEPLDDEGPEWLCAWIAQL